ncbi:uncharacterized protein METZ01_LOCUS253630 [marine metagenome]|uniref:Uncharacterized protein n=1 Tax=marine metagenome TaxID=408172 RepID=A0A382IME2_9ZZZZ
MNLRKLSRDIIIGITDPVPGPTCMTSPAADHIDEARGFQCDLPDELVEFSNGCD